MSNAKTQRRKDAELTGELRKAVGIMNLIAALAVLEAWAEAPREGTRPTATRSAGRATTEVKI